MSGMVNDVFVLAMVAAPFVAMPLLWRRMKRVRTLGAELADPPVQQLAWEEGMETEGELTLARSHRPNDDLIALGEKGRHAPWPVTNE